MRLSVVLAATVVLAHVAAVLAPCPSAYPPGLDLSGPAPSTAPARPVVSAEREAHDMDQHGTMHAHHRAGGHEARHAPMQRADHASEHAVAHSTPHHSAASPDANPEPELELKASCRCGCGGASPARIAPGVALGKMLVSSSSLPPIVSPSEGHRPAPFVLPARLLREIDHVPISA